MTLVTYLGGIDVAGGKLKESGLIHWSDPNTSANNSSGFTAIPGGTGLTGTYFGMGKTSNWWSTTLYAETGGEAMFVYYDQAAAANLWQFQDVWLSVRCIKN